MKSLKKIIFDYESNFENDELVQIYICENYVENVDFEMHIGYGDDVMNAFDIFNEKMLVDEKLNDLLSNCEILK